MFTCLLFLFISLLSVKAQNSSDTIVITVSNSSDPNQIFTPNVVFAQPGQTVVFNFTQGNHSAIESTFADPCIAASLTSTINGFNSGFRPSDSPNSPSVLSVPIINGTNFPRPQFFFDWNNCGLGAVGIINPNQTADETIDGFQRNAVRLNGTESSSSSSSGTRSSTSKSSNPTGTTSNNNNNGAQSAHIGGQFGMPMLVLGLGFLGLLL